MMQPPFNGNVATMKEGLSQEKKNVSNRWCSSDKTLSCGLGGQIPLKVIPTLLLSVVVMVQTVPPEQPP